MTSFWDGPIYRVVRHMKATGNAPGLIERWKNMVGAWAMCNPGADAEAIKAWLPAWQVRPYYTAAELAPLFPALAVTLGATDRLLPAWRPATLKHALIYARLPHFEHDGVTYFVVEQCHRAKEIEMEFRNAQHG